MVKSPDYVYGIVPDLGEYGFQHQPSVADNPSLARIQSLAGSFQWVGTDTANPIAIAIDRGLPNLLAHFTTDPGDPDGRLSLRMRAWLCQSDHELAELLPNIWPDEQLLPVTRQEFIDAAMQRSDGRWITGPANQFTAIDFNQNWGGRSGKPQAPTTRRPPAASRNVKHPQSVNSSSRGRSSSTLPKLFASLMTLVAILGIGAAVKFYWDFETASTAATQTKNDLIDTEEKLAELNTKLSLANEAIQNNQIEIRSQRRSIEQSQSENQGLVKEIERLQGIIASNPEKIDQKELADLRLLKEAVERYVSDGSLALKQLENAIP